jgi:hypothetical protein
MAGQLVRSVSSSMRLNFVRRRSGMSRMYVACTSERSKTSHQPPAPRRGVVGGADERDDLVDVDDGDEQALDEVQPVARPCPLGTRTCAAGRRRAVLEVDLEQLAQPSVRGWPSTSATR